MTGKGAAVSLHCANCGCRLASEPWMKPGVAYWCWPCSQAHLEHSFAVIKQEFAEIAKKREARQ